MKEAVLKDFFKGTVSTRELLNDLSGTLRSSRDVKYYTIEDMAETFIVLPEHLVKLCDVVIDGDLDPYDLHPIGFCIVASDYFEWDEVYETVLDWANYNINYKLTIDTVRKFRLRLVTGKDLFTKDDLYSDRHGKSKD